MAFLLPLGTAATSVIVAAVGNMAHERSLEADKRKVTNAQIVKALSDLGFGGVVRIPNVTKGAQSTEFRRRLRNQGIDDRIMDAAVALAQGDEEALNALGVETATDVKDPGSFRVANPQGFYDSLASQGVEPPPAKLMAPPGPVQSGVDEMAELQAAKQAQRVPVKATATPRAQIPGGGDATVGAVAVNAAMERLAPTPTPQTPAQLRAQIEASYGWAAGLMDVPQVSRILDSFANGQITMDEVGNQLRATDYYKTTTSMERTWQALLSTDPADAAYRQAMKRTALADQAMKLGVTIDPERLDHLADLSLRHGWDGAQIQRFMAAEVRYDPAGRTQQIFETLKGTTREFLVPLSDGAMQAWAQGIIGGTQTAETFTSYLREQATSLFPSLKTALADPSMTVRKYLDPYGQVAAQTLGINEADIEWTDPKWSRFINQVDPKTNQRTIMSLAEVQRTLIADPTYGWADTAKGQEAKASFSLGLAKAFGFS